MKKLLIIALLLCPALSFASNWECINYNVFFPNCNTWRWKVPAGWLVSVRNYTAIGVVFYPDVTHEWDGK